MCEITPCARQRRQRDTCRSRGTFVDDIARMRSQKTLIFGGFDHAQRDAVFGTAAGTIKILVMYLARILQPGGNLGKPYFGFGENFAPSRFRQRLDPDQWRVADAALDAVDNGRGAVSDGVDQVGVIISRGWPTTSAIEELFQAQSYHNTGDECRADVDAVVAHLMR